MSVPIGTRITSNRPKQGECNPTSSDPINSCLLKALSDAHLRGSWGLRGVFPSIRLDEQLLACCSGSGLILKDQSLRQCDLKRRLTRLKILEQDYREKYGDRAYRPPPLSSQPKVTQRLQEISLQKEARGILLTEPSKDLPSLLWGTALIATWKFALNCKVIRLGDPKLERQLVSDPATQSDKPFVVLLEADGDLAEAHKLHQFQFVVSFCYRGRFPLWMSQPEPQGSGFSPALTRRLRKFCQKSLAELVSPPTASKLSQLCNIEEDQSLFGIPNPCRLRT